MHDLRDQVEAEFLEASTLHYAWRGELPKTLFAEEYEAQFAITIRQCARVHFRTPEESRTRRLKRRRDYMKARHHALVPLKKCRECGTEMPRKVGKPPSYCAVCKSNHLAKSTSKA